MLTASAIRRTASCLNSALYFFAFLAIDPSIMADMCHRFISPDRVSLLGCSTISPWLAGFSVFLFLSLATLKRFSELQNNRAQGVAPTGGRGYLLTDIEQLRSSGTAAGYAAVVVFSLYINSHEVIALYPHAARMWLIVPLMILWISRVWLLAGRGQLDEDAVVFAVTDRVSLLTGLCAAIVAIAAM